MVIFIVLHKADVGLGSAAMVSAVRIEDGLQLAHQGGGRRIRKAEAVEDALRPRGRGRTAGIRIDAVHAGLTAEIGLVVGTEGSCGVDSEIITDDLHAFDLACVP